MGNLHVNLSFVVTEVALLELMVWIVLFVIYRIHWMKLTKMAMA